MPMRRLSRSLFLALLPALPLGCVAGPPGAPIRGAAFSSPAPRAVLPALRETASDDTVFVSADPGGWPVPPGDSARSRTTATSLSTASRSSPSAAAP